MARTKYKKSNYDIIIDIYKEMYLNATPSADFSYLVETGRIDDEGLIHIPYEDYYLDNEKQTEIIEKHILKNKVTNHDASSIRMSVYLGCSPRSVK